MNPNSANQRWALFEYRVYPDSTHRAQFHTVKHHCARFGRKVFGSATKMRLVCRTDDHARLYWEIAALTEGHPVHEAAYTEFMHAQWRKFLTNGFGPTCEIQAHARLEAGDREDGSPADQLIIIPLLQVSDAHRPGNKTDLWLGGGQHE